MIQSLRRRHLRTFLVLSFTLPLVFLLGLIGRKRLPVMAQLPETTAGPFLEWDRTLWERADLWPPHAVAARLVGGPIPLTDIALDLMPAHAIIAPDLLVYWYGGNPNFESGLPPDSYLLGALNGTESKRFLLPAAARTRDGTLALFSLGHQKMIAATVLPHQAFAAEGEVHE